MILADWLRCPVCHQDLHHRTNALACSAGHSFDVARQGYVNLLRGPAPAHADTPAMLDARARFLARGHYLPLTQAIAEQTSGARRIVEVGAGTGYNLAGVLDDDAWGLATDISVAAAKRTARSHRQIHSVVADTWAGLPVRDGLADAVLCVFAPRNPSEFARILAPGGRLIVAVPLPEHLAELRAAHGLLDVAADKVTTITTALAGWQLVARTNINGELRLSAQEIHDLIAMGPNAFHGLPESVSATVTTLAVAVLSFTRLLTC